MKTISASLKENIYNFILFASIGFAFALIAAFLIKLLSIIILGFLVLTIIAWQKK
ncbi:hypothetical protein [Flavobacterium sp.]|uniref:hypothetical protein n=1 Tax=Flavobacterium sp. TaxID=239 RepID=UPI00326479B2